MLRFSFSVGDVGWLDLTAGFGDQVFFASYGWCTNFLDELLQGVLDLFDPENGCAACVKGDREGSVDVWRLSLHGDTLAVEIDSFQRVNPLDREPYPDEKRTEHQAFQCESKAFLTALLQGMTALLRNNGFSGYRQNWDAEFPTGLYLRLACLCGEGTELGTEEIPPEENQGIEAVRSDLLKELAFMKKAAGPDRARREGT